MMNEHAPQPHVVGVSPWLPWPLSAWAWCNEPVRAERLAALRIGIALCVLADIAINYAPGLTDFFTKDSLGAAEASDWRFQAPRTTWNLLRGFGDEMNMHLALGVWLLAGGWIILNSLSRLAFMHRNPPANDRTGVALVLAVCGHAWYCAAVWARIVASKKPDELAWIVPLAGLSLVSWYIAIELSTRLRDPDHPIPRFGLSVAWLVALALLELSLFVWACVQPGFSPEWWHPVFDSWQQHDVMMFIAMSLWIAFTVLLLVGCYTKFAAVMVWILGMSFGNLNPNIDNAGDTIRMLILFYLMFCPCGAVWSIDGWRARSHAPRGNERNDLVPTRSMGTPIFVHPWAIRLLFFQMIFIYSMNGYYKMFGDDWLRGYSLHYVMGDVALARFSQMLLPLPIELTRVMAWTVLAWEVTFPLLVLWKWTRRPTLVFGVLFHLGIFATMELAGFALYAICLYLPLVPWERWCKDKRESPEPSEPGM